MEGWIVRDSIYGNISVTDEIIIELINSKEFQRLRRILQLGGGQYVFPCAVHNRFTHSIGVYHLITKIFANESFEILSAEDKLITKIAGLLHDLGHGPFSHSFENISEKNHEQWTIEIITNENTEVNKILKKHHIDSQSVCKIISKEHQNNALLSLVSSQIDCDRMDYLIRDSYHTGVEYGKFDIGWITQNIKIHQEQIMFDVKALFAIENYLLARYHMYWQVYNHKVGISFDHLLKTIFKRLKVLFKSNYCFKSNIDLISNLLDNTILSLEKFLELDDYSLISLFKCLIQENDFILKDLARRIVNRDFFKLVSNFQEKDLKKYERLLVEQNYDLDYYLIVDKFSQPVLYKATDKNQAIKLIDKKSQVFNLEEKSQLVNMKQESKKQTYILVPKEINV